MAQTIVTLLSSGHGDYRGAGVLPLSWVVGDRVLTVSQLLAGLIEVAVIVLVAILVKKRAARTL